MNYVNANASENVSVWVLPVFNTEDAESWVVDTPITPFFLRPNVILGGYYYSVSSEERELVFTLFRVVYYDDFTENNVQGLRNFFYIFGVKYFLFEKSARQYYPVFPGAMNSYNPTNLENGLTALESMGIVKLALNNSLYEVYETRVNSSFVFWSTKDYTFEGPFTDENLSSDLTPLTVKFVNSAEYVMKSDLTSNETVYIYAFIPYSPDWTIKGGQVLAHEDYYGFNLFVVKLYSSELTLINEAVLEPL
ncbi:MAG: hypothetical protein ACP5HQ_04240 [Thermoprotei archaeon]